MRKAIILAIMLLVCSLAGTASADSIPEAIANWMDDCDGSADIGWRDYLAFDLPDGGKQAFVLDGEGWGLYGFALENGEWRNRSSGQAMEEHSDIRLLRHSTAQQRADGSLYPDDLGFDVVCRKDGSRLSYHFDGQYFEICGWYDPARYPGEVIVRGSQLEYYAPGQQQPEAIVDAGDQLYSWIWNFADHPATPEEAQALGAILENSIQDQFPGYTMQSYTSFNGGTEAQASYYSLTDGILRVKRVAFGEGGVIRSQVDAMPAPLSATLLKRLETEPIDQLIDTSGGGDTFLTDDALDTGRIPIEGKVIRSDLQRDSLVLLVEDGDSGRRLQVVAMASDGSYQISAATSVLPKDTSLDLFHNGDGEIYFQWGGQKGQAGYARNSDGEWRLNWARIASSTVPSTEYSGCFCGISLQGPWVAGNADQLLIGSLDNTSLQDVDLAALPATEAELRSALNRDGWAVVHNPDPGDRLHLRTKPDKAAQSLGKFYNGTPLRVLGQKGDWTQVAIGLDGLNGWMMTKYLTFGEAMDAIEPAFPQKIYLAEMEEQQPAYQDMKLKTEKTLEGYVHVVGVVEDDLYILLTSLGATGYVPQDWMWDGNG